MKLTPAQWRILNQLYDAKADFLDFGGYGFVRHNRDASIAKLQKLGLVKAVLPGISRLASKVWLDLPGYKAVEAERLRLKVLAHVCTFCYLKGMHSPDCTRNDPDSQ